MDYAIAPLPQATAPGAHGEAWQVLCLRDRRGVEVAQRLASFGYRGHAEAFLADLLAGGEPGHAPMAAIAVFARVEPAFRIGRRGT